MGTSFKKYVHIWTSKKCQFWKRQAPKNPEDPSNEIFKILNMGPISIKKHEWIFAIMIPISISEHKKCQFLEF